MGILDILIIILIIGWLGGFSLHFGGNFIHTLLVIALILLILRFVGIWRNILY